MPSESQETQERRHHQTPSEGKEAEQAPTSPSPSPSLKLSKSDDKYRHHRRRHHRSSTKERQASPSPSVVRSKKNEHGEPRSDQLSSVKGKQNVAASTTWSTASSVAHGQQQPKTPTLERPRLSALTFGHSQTSYSQPQTVGNLSLLEAGRTHEHRSSNTWTSSSAYPDSPSEDDVIDDRTPFVEEYNRLAKKYRVRCLIPGDFPGIVGKPDQAQRSRQGSWLSHMLRKPSRESTTSITSRKDSRHHQLKRERSISDVALGLVGHHGKKDDFKGQDLRELVRLCGKSSLYLPAGYAPCSLVLPTCLRALAQYLVQYSDTKGIFRVSGSARTINALYDYYSTDVDTAAISSTTRCPTLPTHINYNTHDVACTFKRFLAGLPGGILGSLSLFDALVAIHSQLHPGPDLHRTKETKLRARLIALAVGSVRSRYQRALICGVFGLLCLIGRAAETAAREDANGLPLPTHDLMGYNALGIVFGPLLVGGLINNYSMKVADPSSGLVLLPISSPKSRKERHGHKRKRSHKHGSKRHDVPDAAAFTVDRLHVANAITEMLIVHWREVVRQMRSLDSVRATGNVGPNMEFDPSGPGYNGLGLPSLSYGEPRHRNGSPSGVSITPTIIIDPPRSKSEIIGFPNYEDAQSDRFHISRSNPLLCRNLLPAQRILSPTAEECSLNSSVVCIRDQGYQEEVHHLRQDASCRDETTPTVIVDTCEVEQRHSHISPVNETLICEDVGIPRTDTLSSMACSEGPRYLEVFRDTPGSIVRMTDVGVSTSCQDSPRRATPPSTDYVDVVKETPPSIARLMSPRDACSVTQSNTGLIDDLLRTQILVGGSSTRYPENEDAVPVEGRKSFCMESRVRSSVPEEANLAQTTSPHYAESPHSTSKDSSSSNDSLLERLSTGELLPQSIEEKHQTAEDAERSLTPPGLPSDENTSSLEGRDKENSELGWCGWSPQLVTNRDSRGEIECPIPQRPSNIHRLSLGEKQVASGWSPRLSTARHSMDILLDVPKTTATGCDWSSQSSPARGSRDIVDVPKAPRCDWSPRRATERRQSVDILDVPGATRCDWSPQQDMKRRSMNIVNVSKAPSCEWSPQQEIQRSSMDITHATKPPGCEWFPEKDRARQSMGILDIPKTALCEWSPQRNTQRYSIDIVHAPKPPDFDSSSQSATKRRSLGTLDVPKPAACEWTPIRGTSRRSMELLHVPKTPGCAWSPRLSTARRSIDIPCSPTQRPLFDVGSSSGQKASITHINTPTHPLSPGATWNRLIESAKASTERLARAIGSNRLSRGNDASALSSTHDLLSPSTAAQKPTIPEGKMLAASRKSETPSSELIVTPIEDRATVKVSSVSMGEAQNDHHKHEPVRNRPVRSETTRRSFTKPLPGAVKAIAALFDRAVKPMPAADENTAKQSPDPRNWDVLTGRMRHRESKVFVGTEEKSPTASSASSSSADEERSQLQAVCEVVGSNGPDDKSDSVTTPTAVHSHLLAHEHRQNEPQLVHEHHVVRTSGPRHVHAHEVKHTHRPVHEPPPGHEHQLIHEHHTTHDHHSFQEHQHAHEHKPLCKCQLRHENQLEHEGSPGYSQHPHTIPFPAFRDTLRPTPTYTRERKISDTSPRTICRDGFDGPPRLGTMIPLEEEPDVGHFIARQHTRSSAQRHQHQNQDQSPTIEHHAVAPGAELCEPETTKQISGNSSLHAQIRHLQRHLEFRREEITQLRRRCETLQNMDIGTLSDQLRHAKRECMMWRKRAEAAEKRLAVFRRFTSRFPVMKGERERGAESGTEGEDGDGESVCAASERSANLKRSPAVVQRVDKKGKMKATAYQPKGRLEHTESQESLLSRHRHYTSGRSRLAQGDGAMSSDGADEDDEDEDEGMRREMTWRTKMLWDTAQDLFEISSGDEAIAWAR